MTQSSSEVDHSVGRESTIVTSRRHLPLDRFLAGEYKTPIPRSSVFFMRKVLIQIVLTVALIFVIIALFRTNLSLRTQLSVIRATPSRSSF